MYLEISKQNKRGIKFLLETDDENIDIIISALHDIPPTIENIAYKITEKIIQVKKLDKDATMSVINTLISLRQFYKEEGLSKEIAVDLISESITNDKEFIAGMEEVARFKNRLFRLLEGAEKISLSLDISDKASDLLLEHERIFSTSRIVTDIRPIFDSKTEGNIEATILIHTLKILYKDIDGTKEFYVSLDSNDLDNLHKQIMIAINNREAIENILEKSEIKCINPMAENRILEELENEN
jgi:hypothetical protein